MNWRDVHAALCRLAKKKGAYDAEEARWLREANAARVWEHLGLGSLGEYLERLFGYGPRQANERLRVAEQLVYLPEIAEALAEGQLSWSAVRELSRVALPATEGEWIEAAKDRTVREIEDMVSGRRPGDLPEDPAEPAARKQVLRFEVSADTFAALREARKHIEIEVGHPLDDNEALRALADRALASGGETDPDPARANHQILLTVCEECGRGFQDGSGRSVEVDATVVETAMCDAQLIGGTHVGDPERATQTIPPKTRRFVWQRDHGRCVVPGCRAAKFLDLHHVVFRADGGSSEAENLALTCSMHHRLLHEGKIHIKGFAPDRLEFTFADGRPYGALPPADATLRQDVATGLRRLGFSRAEAKRAVAAAIGDTAAELVRSALGILHREKLGSSSEPRAPQS